MRDVGRAAGVSQSTVSRVLTPTATSLPINEATRRRVLAKVKELGYHPNQYARSLRGKKSHMLAMMVADFARFLRQSPEPFSLVPACLRGDAVFPKPGDFGIVSALVHESPTSQRIDTAA